MCTLAADRERAGAISASDFNARSELSFDSIEGRGGGAAGHGHGHGHGPGAGPTLSAITAGLQNLHTRESRSGNGYGAGAGPGPSSELGGGGRGLPNVSDDQMLESWLEDLQATGAKIVLVTYPRTANNDKELSVMRGEYLEVRPAPTLPSFVLSYNHLFETLDP